ncbi:MAG: ATP-binding protein, partial [Planctomycetota bacterium]
AAYEINRSLDLWLLRLRLRDALQWSVRGLIGGLAAGLGLALVRRIVETHNGSLDVESRLVKGSIFRVFFPAADPAIGPAQDTNVPLTGSSSAPPADQR